MPIVEGGDFFKTKNMAKKKTEKEVKKPSGIKVEILAHNMAGKYGLPYSPGNIVEFEDEKQAKEIIEAGDGVEA